MAQATKTQAGLFENIKSVFVGPGSLTDFGQRFVILDKHYQSSIDGMYCIGDVAGTPDIKAALNAGYHVGQHLGSLPKRCSDQVDYDVVIIGAGPAGINAASELKKVGKKVLVLERKRIFQTVRAFANSKALFLASTGDKDILGDFEFTDCSAEQCIESWDKVLDSKKLEIHTDEEVKEVKQRGAFEVWTKVKSKVRGEKDTEQKYLADRIVVAVGKPRLLEKLSLEGASDERVRYQLRYDGGLENSNVLVIAHAGSYEGFEMALDMCPKNTVTLIYEEDSDDMEVTKDLSERVEAAAAAGRLKFYKKTKLTEIGAKTVTLQLPKKSGGGPLAELMDAELKDRLDKDGRLELANDVIFTGKIIERELPATDLRRFGLNTERRMTPMRWSLLGVLALFFAFVYMGKSGKLDVIWPGFANVRTGIEKFFGGLQMYQIWTIIYSAAIVIFGTKAILKYRGQYRDAEQGSHQTIRLLSLMFFQVFFLAILPELILKNWRAYGLVLAWPLNLQPGSYPGFISFNEGDPVRMELFGLAFNDNRLYFLWTIVLSFVLIPLFVWRKGMRYCTWICSCGGLAETVGDEWRQFSPKGPANEKRELSMYVVLAFTAVIMLLAVLKHHGWTPAALSGVIGASVTGWSWVVDLFMCGIIPLVLYPYLGGRTWCRYACPTAGFMKLMGRKTTVTGIQPDRKRCIACGSCDRFCEVGVSIKKRALKGKFFSANDTTCISCGVCISVCPTDVLSFQLHPDKRPLPMAV